MGEGGGVMRVVPQSLYFFDSCIFAVVNNNFYWH